jgi:hypothetical protein
MDPAKRRVVEAVTSATSFGSITLRGEVLDVVRSQKFREVGFECLELAEFFDVGELHRVDGAIFGLRDDQNVDDANDSAVDESEKLFGHLAGEVAGSARELDDEVIDRSEFTERYIGHRAPFRRRDFSN